MSEPLKIVAGTTISWSRPHTGEAAASYEYILLSEDNKITISAGYVDGELLVSVSAATSADYAAGVYNWHLLETIGQDVNLLSEGRIEIKANPAQQSTSQALSHNEKMLSAIRKRLEGRILTDHENYSIEGRSLSRIPFDTLKKLETDYAWKVHHERVARGERKAHRSVRFR
ncbi:hypothetical protein GCM10011369_23360 [Neiella marina]|uniref:Uncharacterized protein n=1 Tax=Neiella marina TaxID=508461 RepID=A0A8J2U5X6_9GAMM|nr:hypothetical protein [Neiella marina]GGA80738.1 hypothetical protein GCM10011369_23360 [Neiella marina]